MSRRVLSVPATRRTACPPNAPEGVSEGGGERDSSKEKRAVLEGASRGMFTDRQKRTILKPTLACRRSRLARASGIRRKREREIERERAR